jgi:hypothetical protein
VSFFAPECAINHFLDFLKIEDEKREEKIWTQCDQFMWIGVITFRTENYLKKIGDKLKKIIKFFKKLERKI